MSEHLRFQVDGSQVEYADGQTLLEALLFADRHPTGGGCLCAAGDCPHCLVTLDGVGYVRACQVRARPGMVVARDHRRGGVPPLPLDAPAMTADDPGVPVRYRRCDVVVIGQGSSGRAAAAEAESGGQSVLAFDVGRGEEVIGIYPGPLVVARTPEGMVHVEPRVEIVVATGAMEIHPVAPGNDLEGIVTRRAAERLAAAGLDLGRVVALGHPPSGVSHHLAEGELVRFEGDERLSAMVVATADGDEIRHACDTAVIGLGLYPRDVLARMANGIGGTVGVRVVGDASLPAAVPRCPSEGTVCPCSSVTVAHLDSVWDRGFREMELLKRATLAGTGTCQGGVCMPYLRAFLSDRGERLQAPFTARPLSRQRTIGEVAAGEFHHATPRTALDEEHRRRGAMMERAGGWFRPWRYDAPDAEYRAAREAVSIGDVSTLGKMLVSGPDALELLERLYPTRVATLRPGRSRYALMLDERGYVLDDGMICRDPDGDDGARYRLTFTSAGSTFVELWMRDWADSWGLDVRLMNQTMSLGAINVTGPSAAELLTRCGATALPDFGSHAPAIVAGVECHVFRLSFTGELSYELHHAAVDSIALWRRLLERGEALGCRPHGLEALLRMRLEKGHILVGQDTDYDSTPRRLDHEWAVKLDKDDFVGRLSVLRTNRRPLDRRLVGLEMEGSAPIEGAVIWHGDDYAGYVTSSTHSPTLERSVLLGWVRTVDDEGGLPDELTVDGRPARRATLPFYDPEGARARIAVAPANGAAGTTSTPAPPRPPRGLAALGDRTFERVGLTRVVARPSAIDAWLRDRAPEHAAGAPLLRTASDELLVPARLAPADLEDPHALVETEWGHAAAWFPADEAASILTATCEWELPTGRPAFAQGAVAQIPVKLWLEKERVLFIVPHAYLADLEHRIAMTRRAEARG